MDQSFSEYSLESLNENETIPAEDRQKRVSLVYCTKFLYQEYMSVNFYCLIVAPRNVSNVGFAI